MISAKSKHQQTVNLKLMRGSIPATPTKTKKRFHRWQQRKFTTPIQELGDLGRLTSATRGATHTVLAREVGLQ